MSKKHQVRKLDKYVREDNLSKLKSYIRKHAVNVNMILEDKTHNGTLLHLACVYGSSDSLRYLLKKGADPLLCDGEGNLPLHAAAIRAIQGAAFAYSDLVLPLVKECKEALDKPNKKRITPRDLLASFKEKMKTRDDVSEQSSSSGSESEDVGDTSWWHHLAGEAEDEYTGEWGNYEQDFVNPDEEPDTYENWTQRMSRQYHTKQQQKRKAWDTSAAQASRKKKKTEEEEKKRIFTRKLQKDHEEYIKKTAARKLHRQRQKYEEMCNTVFNSESMTSLTYQDIPWPFSKNDGVENIDTFLFSDIKKDEEKYKKYLKEQQIRWHPDKFMQKCGTRLLEEEREKILETVKEVSQMLNKISESGNS